MHKRPDKPLSGAPFRSPGLPRTLAGAGLAVALAGLAACPLAAQETLPALPDAPDPSSIRNVTPGGILPLPPLTGPLKRIAPRLPERTVVEVPSEVTLKQPVVVDAGTLKAGRLTIRLAGVAAPAPDATCPSRLGGTWPCGMRARTALRAFVRRLAVQCDDMSEVAPGLVTATCQRNGVDLADWLVRQGWADPLEDAPEALRTSAEEAREARRGRWKLDGLPELPDALSLPENADDSSEIGARIAPPVIPDTGFGAAERTQRPAEAGSAQRSGYVSGDIEIVDTPWHPENTGSN